MLRISAFTCHAMKQRKPTKQESPIRVISSDKLAAVRGGTEVVMSCAIKSLGPKV